MISWVAFRIPSDIRDFDNYLNRLSFWMGEKSCRNKEYRYPSLIKML